MSQGICIETTTGCASSTNLSLETICKASKVSERFVEVNSHLYFHCMSQVSWLRSGQKNLQCKVFGFQKPLHLWNYFFEGSKDPRIFSSIFSEIIFCLIHVFCSIHDNRVVLNTYFRPYETKASLKITKIWNFRVWR